MLDHVLTDRMHGELNGILNSHREYLMDPVIAIRDSCYCLPVRIEYKLKVPGVVHDTSSTGSTVFIEPMAVIRINNELKELEALIEEATAEANAIRDSIKAEMVARNIEEMNLGKFIIRFTAVLSSRFDTKRFKEAFGEELYKAYTKEVSSRRFSIA